MHLSYYTQCELNIHALSFPLISTGTDVYFLFFFKKNFFEYFLGNKVNKGVPLLNLVAE